MRKAACSIRVHRERKSALSVSQFAAEDRLILRDIFPKCFITLKNAKAVRARSRKSLLEW
jgi:hypothetical protein